MRKDYDILGIEENADKKTVKKAYFKLIREYTPEKDPERFQEIRAAYERLIEEMEHPANSIQLEFPADDKFARNMFDQIQQLIHEEDYSKALKTAEEGVRYYGEVECFLYMVAKCSILNDKTGKAVKAYEKLEERYPDKLLYKGELARAYYMRGYTNKAYNMFRKAYAEGWREYEFLTDYSMCCGNREKFDEGIDVLKTYVNSLSPQEKKKNTAELMNAYIGMYTMSRTDTQEQDEIIQEILNFLDIAGDDVSEYEEMVASLYMMVMMSGHSLADSRTKLLNRLQEILPEGMKSGELGLLVQFFKAKTDERFGPLMQYTIEESLSMASVLFSEDSDFADFIFMDLTLCHLEAWPSQKNELAVLRKEYPNVYEMGAELWEYVTYSGPMRAQIKSELKIMYARKEREYPGEGKYYEFYPDKRVNVDQVQWDSLDSGTYVREERKIGRNEPCPCGSGKKYKNCCGKNK